MQQNFAQGNCVIVFRVASKLMDNHNKSYVMNYKTAYILQVSIDDYLCNTSNIPIILAPTYLQSSESKAMLIYKNGVEVLVWYIFYHFLLDRYGKRFDQTGKLIANTSYNETMFIISSADVLKTIQISSGCLLPKCHQLSPYLPHWYLAHFNQVIKVFKHAVNPVLLCHFISYFRQSK